MASHSQHSQGMEPLLPAHPQNLAPNSFAPAYNNVPVAMDFSGREQQRGMQPPGGPNFFVPQPQAFTNTPQLAWSGKLYEFWGKGSDREWLVCCLTTHSFPFAFGYSMKKALALSLWQQTALCFLCAQMVLYIAYSQVAYCDTVSYDPYSCHEVVRVFIIVAEVLSFVFTGAYCGWRRTQIRKTFGIPGDEELRTMEAYNIENGVMRVEATESMHRPVEQSFGGAEV